MGKLPIAVQVYSIREEAQADFRGTMRHCKEMGYDGVELAGMYGMKPDQVKECLEEVGLIPISAHIPYEELEKDLEGTLEAYRQIGIHYAVIPFLVPERRYGEAKYQETMDYLHVVARACADRGLQLLYHNHDFEFAKTDHGTYAFDELYAEFTREELQTEQDTCWVKVAGEDPVAYLEKYRGRCPLVHLKDFSKKEGASVELLPLGDGEQEVKAVADQAMECGALWLVIEQDEHPYGKPLEDMEKSLVFLQSILAQP